MSTYGTRAIPAVSFRAWLKCSPFWERFPLSLYRLYRTAPFAADHAFDRMMEKVRFSDKKWRRYRAVFKMRGKRGKRLRRSIYGVS